MNDICNPFNNSVPNHLPCHNVTIQHSICAVVFEQWYFIVFLSNFLNNSPNYYTFYFLFVKLEKRFDLNYPRKTQIVAMFAHVSIGRGSYMYIYMYIPSCEALMARHT